jgi:hypothetical protein
MLVEKVLWAWLLAAVGVPIYRGEVALPADWYTPSGTHLEARKYPIEIRQSEGGLSLAFLDGDRVVDSIPGRPPRADQDFTVPQLGAVLLWPVTSKPTEPKSKLSPYLTNISWEAVLRIYGARKKPNTELRALLRVKDKTVEFPLYLEKPAAPVSAR